MQANTVGAAQLHMLFTCILQETCGTCVATRVITETTKCSVCVSCRVGGRQEELNGFRAQVKHDRV